MKMRSVSKKKSEAELPEELKSRLEAVIQNLEEFTNQNEKESFPHVQNLDIKDNVLVARTRSPLKKALDFVAALSSKVRQKHHEKRLQVQLKLMESIDFLKTHYRILHKHSQGSKSEQEWANWAQAIINRYNATIRRSTKTPSSLGKRAERFLYEQSGFLLGEEITNNTIDIPHHFSVQFGSSQERKEYTIGKIRTFFQQTGGMTPTQEEKDAFHMKTIVLAGKSDLPATIQQGLHSLIRETPIVTHVSSASNPTEGNEEQAIILLNQILNPFPGEKITIYGAFKRDARSTVLSVPIPESFHFSTQAKQTGFPHPSQHTGWSLSNSLIPDCPHRLDQIPLFSKIYEMKKQMAAALLPMGQLNEKAKTLLKLKKEVFDQNSALYLKLHRNLALSLLTAETEFHEPIKKEVSDILTTFYHELEMTESPFATLTLAYQIILNFFIDVPYEYLCNEWLEKPHLDLSSQDPKTRYQSCLNLLDTKQESAVRELTELKKQASTTLEIALYDYVLVLGNAIGTASRAIMLQQLSEKIGFPPPLLNDFEQKIQACAIKQLFWFHAELQIDLQDKSEVKELLQANLEKWLSEEIALFQAESCESLEDHSVAITNELEFYYNARHFSRL